MSWPNFLVIGAARCGTTSLYHYLAEHPQVFMSPIKETNYFAYRQTEQSYYISGGAIPERRFTIRTEDEYLALFDGATDETAIGEASPVYLSSKGTAQVIHTRLPDVRLVVILRNPIHRAYSGYHLFATELGTTLPVEQAFDTHQHWVQQGFYSERLQAYFDLFDRSQIKVLLFEDLKTDTQKLMSDLYAFLEVDPYFCPSSETAYNAAGLPRSRRLISLMQSLRPATTIIPRSLRQSAYALIRPILIRPARPMPEAIHEKLHRCYKDEIARLSSLLDLDLEARWQ